MPEVTIITETKVHIVLSKTEAVWLRSFIARYLWDGKESSSHYDIRQALYSGLSGVVSMGDAADAPCVRGEG